MKTYDLHQDLLTHVRFAKRLGQSHQTSWDDIEQSSIDLLVATAFPFPDNDDQYDPSVVQLITEELQLYREYVFSHQDSWQLVQSATDLDSQKKKLLLHIEGLNVFDGSDAAWQQLNDWIALGVRSVGTHWNIENQLGGGTLQPEQSLTKLGYEVIAYLEKQDLVFDLAHMGRQSFADATKCTTRPLYVSHGNADAVCSNVRNYTDEQLRKIAETDGVIGVFFAGTFVAGKQQASTIDDVLAHILYMKQLIGVRHIALGSDWGGIVLGGVAGLTQVTELPQLYASLQTCGFTTEEIEAVAWRNADRVLRSHLT